VRSVPGAALLSLTLVGIALALIGYLHAVSGVSPVSGMVSDYVFTPVGAVLLPVAVLVLAAGLMVLRRALIAAGAAGRVSATLLVTAALGAALIGLFRADPTGAPVTTTGFVHKLSGGLLFGSVPAAAWALAAGTRWRPLARPLRWLAGASAVLFAGFLASYLPLFGMPFPGGDALVSVQGLLERLVLAPELALVVLLAVAVARMRPARRGAVAARGVPLPVPDGPAPAEPIRTEVQR